MKRQIRYGVFETNSSSTHSLTMMMKDDYVRWGKENLYLYTGYSYGWDFNKPIRGTLYTKEEAIKFVKNSRYYKNRYGIDYEGEVGDDYLKDSGFITSDDEDSGYLDTFYEEFTTPSGETIVAFGEYGYDG